MDGKDRFAPAAIGRCKPVSLGDQKRPRPGPGGRGSTSKVTSDCWWPRQQESTPEALLKAILCSVSKLVGSAAKYTDQADSFECLPPIPAAA